MGTFFAYAIQSSICLAVFYLFYKVLLSRETFHRFNRIGLLGILILSLTIPCTFSLLQHNQEVKALIDSEIQILTGDFIFKSEDVKSETGNGLLSFLLIVYLTGCFLCLLYTILSTIRIIYIIKKGTSSTNSDGTKLILLDNTSISPFSWMKYIVLSKSDHETAGEVIVAHESAHINLHHSIDLLIAQLCIIPQWFNPAVWLFYRELQHIHEYEADDAVIRKGIDAKQYQLLLIKKAVGTRLYSMANSLNHNNLKKRITMMYQKKSNPWARLKYAYVLPLAAITLSVFARPEISQSFEEISNAKVSQFALETSKNEVKNFPENDISLNSDMLSAENNLSDATFSESEAASIQMSSDSIQQTIDDDYVFSKVEKDPEFPGGEAELMKYISKNVKYPEKAIEDSISGRVYCRFVVEKDGSVSNIEVVRGVHPLLDNEAVRVLKTLPKFTPGEVKGIIVRTRYTLPVRFQLSPSGIRKTTTVKADVNEVTKNSPFLVYPNPVNDIINIEINKQDMEAKYLAAGKPFNNPKYEFRLFNASGTMTFNVATYGGNKAQLSVSNLPDGIYFLHIYDGIDTKPEVQQVVIKH